MPGYLWTIYREKNKMCRACSFLYKMFLIKKKMVLLKLLLLSVTVSICTSDNEHFQKHFQLFSFDWALSEKSFRAGSNCRFTAEVTASLGAVGTSEKGKSSESGETPRPEIGGCLTFKAKEKQQHWTVLSVKEMISLFPDWLITSAAPLDLRFGLISQLTLI